MAFRAAALIALGSAAGSAAGTSAGSACPASTNPMIGVVTDLSPECFQECPQMCQPLDGLISEYMSTGSTDTLKAKICADKEPFTCMYAGNHLADCGKVLTAGSAAMKVQLPMSEAQLQQQCGSSGLRGGAATHNDMHSGIIGNQDGNVSAAGGLGVAGRAAAWLLGFLGPAALLFAA